MAIPGYNLLFTQKRNYSTIDSPEYTQKTGKKIIHHLRYPTLLN